MASQSFQFFLSLIWLFCDFHGSFRLLLMIGQQGLQKVWKSDKEERGSIFVETFWADLRNWWYRHACGGLRTNISDNAIISSTVIFPAGLIFKMCWRQSQRNLVSVLTLLTGKFLQICNVFAAGLMVSSILRYYLDDPEDIHMVWGATRKVNVLRSVQIMVWKISGWSEKCLNDSKSVTMNWSVRMIWIVSE